MAGYGELGGVLLVILFILTLLVFTGFLVAFYGFLGGVLRVSWWREVL